MEIKRIIGSDSLTTAPSDLGESLIMTVALFDVFAEKLFNRRNNFSR
jgi:hypothetical protein